MSRQHRLADDNVELATAEVALPDEKEIYVHALSDIHIESPTFRKKAFMARLAELRRSGPNHRILLLGDLSDAAIASSKGFYHGARTPEEALEELLSAFKPLADRVDLIIGGNHERRIERVAGLSLPKLFAALLGQPHTYRSGPTVLRYCLNQPPSKRKINGYSCSAKLYCHHGYGGGMRPGSSVNRIEDLAKSVPDADLYFMGHVHRRNVMQDCVYSGWPLREHRRTFVVTGTYQGHEHYAQEMGLTPQLAEGPPVVRIKREPGLDRPRIEVLS